MANSPYSTENVRVRTAGQTVRLCMYSVQLFWKLMRRYTICSVKISTIANLYEYYVLSSILSHYSLYSGKNVRFSCSGEYAAQGGDITYFEKQSNVFVPEWVFEEIFFWYLGCSFLTPVFWIRVLFWIISLRKFHQFLSELHYCKTPQTQKKRTGTNVENWKTPMCNFPRMSRIFMMRVNEFELKEVSNLGRKRLFYSCIFLIAGALFPLSPYYNINCTNLIFWVLVSKYLKGNF